MEICKHGSHDTFPDDTDERTISRSWILSELSSMVRINNHVVPNDDRYMQGLLDGRVEMAEFLIDIIEEET